MKKFAFLTLVVGLAAGLIFAKDAPVSDPYKVGNHDGEVAQLEVNATFSGSFGETVTDNMGTTYNVWGFSFYEPKVYPPEYWGVFPLYFYDTDVGVTISVKNTDPRHVAKLRVRTECYVIKTDGSSGVSISPAQETTDFEIEVGETKTINSTFTAEYVEGAESGLDRLIIKLLHPNEGGGSTYDPALILLKEAVFCPPEYQGELMMLLNNVLNP